MEHHHCSGTVCHMPCGGHGWRGLGQRDNSVFLFPAASVALRGGNCHHWRIYCTRILSLFISHAAASQSLCLGSSSEQLDGVHWLFRIPSRVPFFTGDRVWRQPVGCLGVIALLRHRCLSVVRVLSSMQESSFRVTNRLKHAAPRFVGIAIHTGP